MVGKRGLLFVLLGIVFITSSCKKEDGLFDNMKENQIIGMWEGIGGGNYDEMKHLIYFHEDKTFFWVWNETEEGEFVSKGTWNIFSGGDSLMIDGEYTIKNPCSDDTKTGSIKGAGYLPKLNNRKMEWAWVSWEKVL